MLKEFIRLFAVAVSIVVGAVGLSAQMTSATAEVTYLKGEIEAVDEFGNEGELRRGRTVGQGVEISTGKNGVLKLAFANGLRLVIEEGTRVRLGKLLMVRNNETRDSDFHLLSTNKEPSFSATEISVVQGSVLMEIPPLNLPVSSFLLNTNYHRAVIQEPKEEAHRSLTKKPIVLRFEQGLDFGRLTVFKGIIHSSPNHLGLGNPSDIPEGVSVLYRFHKPQYYGQPILDRQTRERLDPEVVLPGELDPEAPGFLPGPLPPEEPKDEIDISLISPEPPKKIHRDGLR